MFMNPILWGEIIGIIAIAVSCVVFLCNQRKRILILKGVSDVLWSANNFLLGAFTGGLLNAVGLFREFVFYHRVEKKWAKSRLWMYMFCALCFISPVLETVKTGSIRFLPFLAAASSLLVVCGLYAKEPKTMRLLNLMSKAPWLIYQVTNRNITGTVSCLMTTAFIVGGAILAGRENKKDA